MQKKGVQIGTPLFAQTSTASSPFMYKITYSVKKSKNFFEKNINYFLMGDIDIKQELEYTNQVEGINKKI